MFTSRSHPRTVTVGSHTHPYEKRQNQDALDHFTITEHQENLEITLSVAVVADGISSAPEGAEAAQAVIQTVHAVLSDPAQSGLPIQERLQTAIEAANKTLYQEVLEKPSLYGKGSTVVVAALNETTQQLAVAHVGDSRAYLIRSKNIYQLTQDHSNREGQLNRRLGKHEGVKVDLDFYQRPPFDLLRFKAAAYSDPDQLPLQSGDVVLLCSDGLTELTPSEIQQTVAKHRKPLPIAQQLTLQANEKMQKNGDSRGDDVSVVVMQQQNNPWFSAGTWLLLALVTAVLALLITVGLSLAATLGRLSQPIPPTTAVVPTTIPATAVSAPSAVLVILTPTPILTVKANPNIVESTATPIPTFTTAATATTAPTTIPTATNTSLPPVVTDTTVPIASVIASAEDTNQPSVTTTEIVTATVIPEETAALTSTPTLTDSVLITYQVNLISPENGSESKCEQVFEWEANFVPSAGQAFELFFWPESVPSPDDNPMVGFGLEGLPNQSGQVIKLCTIDLERANVPLEGGTYYWGIRLVKYPSNADDPTRVLKYIGGGWKITYNRP